MILVRNCLIDQAVRDNFRFCNFRKSNEIIKETGLLDKQSSLDEFTKLLSLSKNTSNQVNNVTNPDKALDNVSSKIRTKETISRYLQFGRSEKIDRLAQSEKYFHRESSFDDPMGSFVDKLVEDIAFSNAQLNPDLIKNSLLEMQGDLMSFYKESLDSHGKNYCEKAVDALSEEIGEYVETKFNYLAGGENAPEEIEQWYHGANLEEKLVEHFQVKGFLEKDLSPTMKAKILKRLEPLIARLKQAHGQEFCKEAFKDQKNQASEIFDEYQDEFINGNKIHMNVNDVESFYLKKMKQLGPMKATPRALRPKMQEHLDKEWNRIKLSIVAKRIALAEHKISQLSLDAVKINFNDKNNRDPQLFRQNFAELISFDEDTSLSVESKSKDKLDTLYEQFMERINPIAKETMKSGWDDFWTEMRQFNEEPKTGREFFDSFATFLVQTKGMSRTDVDQYFKMHPNFVMHIESMHETYQKERNEKIKEQNTKIRTVLSPLGQTSYPHANMIQEAILKSFNNTTDLEQKDEWLTELNDKYIKRYQQSMNKLAAQRVTAKEKFGKLKHSQKAQTLRKTMMKTVESHMGTWSSFDENFKGPHDLNDALQSQMSQLVDIEKDWDKKIKDTRKQIDSMSLSDVKDLNDPKKRATLEGNIGAFAKEFNVWTDVDVWEEIKDEFGQKMLALHKEFKTGKGESVEASQLADAITGLKDIDTMNINDKALFDVENDGLMDFSIFRKSFDIQMPEAIWLSKGKKAFDVKALELHRDFSNKRQEHFKKKINTLGFENSIKDQAELVDIRAFRRHPALTVQMTESEWQQWGKVVFDKKVDNLYQDFRADREKLYRTEIDELSLNSLPETALKDPNNLDITNFRKQFDVWMSDKEWLRFGKAVFDDKVQTIFKSFIDKQKEGDESVMSTEAKKASEAIDAVRVGDLDASKIYTDFAEFKRQKFFQENISFDDKIWDQVKEKFDLKSAELFAEHQEKMSPQNRLKDLGQKYGLYRMENIPANSVQDFEKKINRLEELLKKNPLSIKRFLEYNERERMPFLLDMLGEMHLGDMRELMVDMPESRIMNPDEFTEFLFGNTRRQYVLGEAIRKNTYNWYWFTTKNQDIPLAKDGHMKEIEGLTDEQLAEPELDEVQIETGALNIDEPEIEEDPVELAEAALFHENEALESAKLDGEIENDPAGEEDSINADDESLDGTEELDETDVDSDLETDEEEDQDQDLDLDADDSGDSLEEGTEDEDPSSEKMDEGNLDDSEELDDDQLEDSQAEPDTKVDQATDESDELDAQKRMHQRSEKIRSLDSDGEDVVEHSEDGNEDSLPEDWDELIMTEDGQYSAEIFGEIYVKQGMALESILRRVENYVSLLAEKNITLELDMTESIRKSYLKKSKVMFRQIINFMLDQEVKNIEKITFTGEMVTKKTLTVRCTIEKKFGLAQKGFRGLVLNE